MFNGFLKGEMMAQGSVNFNVPTMRYFDAQIKIRLGPVTAMNYFINYLLNFFFFNSNSDRSFLNSLTCA